jgi:hypothetical protein
MRASAIVAAGLVSLAITAAQPTAASAAEYGAIACDTSSLKWGDSWHAATLAQANTLAMNECATAGCKIVIEIGPGLCGSLATAPNPAGWGAASRGTRAAAELGAMENCQNANAGQCKVQASDCNQ